MVMKASPGVTSSAEQPRDRSVVLKKGMSDPPSASRISGGHGGGETGNVGLRQVLEAEASLQRSASGSMPGNAASLAASNASRTAPTGLRPPALRASTSALGTGLRPSFSQRDQMLATMPPTLRASRSLDLAAAASIPPTLRAAQSMDLAAAAAVPPTLRAAQSLDLTPPSLGRASSLELAAARRRVAALGGSFPSGPSAASAAARSMFDQRRFLLSQQTGSLARTGFPVPSAIPGARHTGAPALTGINGVGRLGPWRNMPNEGVTSQGMDLLRAASLSLPNNRVGSGLPVAAMRGATAGAVAMPPALARAGSGFGHVGGAMPVPPTSSAPSGFSPESRGHASDGKKRKAKDGDTSDEESSDRVYIPEVRDLDILCGRGGKSNHHFGNKRYRQVVSEMKMMYRSTEAKTVKTDLSRAIVDHVCSYGGRFVKKDEASGRYYLLTKAEARKKTSQALRETKALKWTM